LKDLTGEVEVDETTQYEDKMKVLNSVSTLAELSNTTAIGYAKLEIAAAD